METYSLRIHRRAALAAAALAATSLIQAPGAIAVDETKPGVACYGLAFTDKKGDAAATAPGAQPGGRENLDLLGGFYKFDSAKAAEAATINLQIADLSTDIPTGSTAVSWYVSYGTAEGDQWLRAITDYTGIVSYEYGHFTILPGTGTTQSVRDGSTQGAFFEGPDGVIQIVMPATGPGKPGTALKAANIFGYEARQVLPGAAPTPAKGGLLYEVDTATTKGGHTVGAPCPAAPAAPPAPVTTPPAVKPPSSLSEAGPLPAKLVTKSVKAKKVKKTLALKLSSSEPLTQVGVQVRKGKAVAGKGLLAKLSGKGTIKVKIAKKLKKGTYTVDLAGTDAKGARRFAVAKLVVKK